MMATRCRTSPTRPEVVADRQAALKIVRADGQSLKLMRDDLRADKEVVLEAVKHHGNSLAFASTALQADREVVQAAIRKTPEALQHASQAVRSDKAFMLEALGRYRVPLRLVSASLRADHDVVLEALRAMDPYHLDDPLEDADASLLTDRHFMYEAMKFHWSALSFASKELRADKDFVLLAARCVRAMDELTLLCGCLLEAGLRDDGSFWQPVNSSIAVQGEGNAPVLQVALSQLPGLAENGQTGLVQGLRMELFECVVRLLSGACFTCRVAEQVRGGVRHAPTVQDLAMTLVEELPKNSKGVLGCKRVFVNFIYDGHSGDRLVTPWDWDRPLIDFLPTPK